MQHRPHPLLRRRSQPMQALAVRNGDRQFVQRVHLSVCGLKQALEGGTEVTTGLLERALAFQKCNVFPVPKRRTRLVGRTLQPG